MIRLDDDSQCAYGEAEHKSFKTNHSAVGDKEVSRFKETLRGSVS